MHLLNPLAAGIRGAENGSVDLVLRGTSTAATYYTDFEATQQLPGTAVPLDSNGRLIAYVSALVDVSVHDVNGVDVCEFVAGDEDAAVEVISPSFTGVDYTSGASGTQKPTTLEKVLDSWITSAGAPDFNVLSNGSAVTLQALGTTFFNVKAYGAIGNGVADEGSALTAANAAATAAGGGIVYFPPGVYRITAFQTLPANVTWLGNGGKSSKLAIDSGVAAGAVRLDVAPAGALSGIIGMWLGAINGASPGILIGATAASSGEFHITDCVLGNDALSNSACYKGVASLVTLKVVFTRCYMKSNAGAVPLVEHQGAGRLIVRDCELISSQATAFTTMVCDDNALIEGCAFDSSAATAGTLRYIAVSPVSGGGVAIIGNRFVGCGTVANPVAIYNGSAGAQFDCLEYGNTFGGALGAHTASLAAYGYAVDGYATLGDSMYACGGHATRQARVEVYGNVAASPLATNPKEFGTTIVNRTAGAAITINATTKGSMGDDWTLHIINNTGVALTVTGGTNIVFDVAVFPGVVSIGSYCRVQLTWLPSNAGVGAWFQTAKAYIA